MATSSSLSAAGSGGAIPYDPPPPYSAKANEAGGRPAPPPQTVTYQPVPQSQQQYYPPVQPVIAQTTATPGGATVILADPTVVGVTTVYGFAQVPVATRCNSCQRDVITVIHYEPGALTWFIFALLMFLCCWILAWIPFVDSSTQDIIHTCPNCGTIIGRYKRM